MENSNNEIKNTTQTDNNKKNTYSKKYYIMFFLIMTVSFLFIFWICNYTKLKELFQIVALMALSITIAEISSRRYL